MHQVIGVVIDQEVVRANRLSCSHVTEGKKDAMEESKRLHYEVTKTQVPRSKSVHLLPEKVALVKEKDWSESDGERRKDVMEFSRLLYGR
jgi:hypothetical protein